MESGTLEAILAMLVGKFPALSGILVILGTLVVIGQVVVLLTPSKSDDAAYSKLMAIPLVGSLVAILSKFSIVQKK